jgi:HK97 family phage portal protein
VSLLNKLLARVLRPVDPNGGFRWLARRGPERVTPDTALSVSAFWGCCRFLTGNIAQLPWHVMLPKKSGGAEEQTNHPVQWVLNNRANPEMGAFIWRQTVLLHALIYGNSYSEIVRDGAGRVTQLWPIHHDRVTLVRDDAGTLFYQVRNAGSNVVTLEAKDIFHLQGMTDDGVCGLPVITYAARSLGLGIAQEEYGSSFFVNSGVPSGVLEHPGKLKTDAIDRLSEQWVGTYAGVRRSQGTMVLEEGMTYKPIGLPPEQAQFLASRQASVEDVARWFGVPPQKIQQLVNSNYDSMEYLAIEVIVDTLMPWVKRFEQEADCKLLNNNWGGLFTRLDVRGLMRGTHKDRAEYYRALFGIGVMSVNDIRAKEDMNPIPKGDVHMLPLNMAPLAMVAEGKLAVNPQPAPGKIGEETDGPDKVQKQEPNPPEPSKAQRLIEQLLDATLQEIEDNNGQRVYVIGPKNNELPN